MRQDMKRWSRLATFVLFIALCMSLTYWAMQLFSPTQRQVIELPPPPADNINLEAAASLFGGRGIKQRSASNYQLKGIVLASDPAQSVAILAENGKPARAIRSGMELAPNVTVKEVQRQYVLLSEAGATTRIDLPEKALPVIGAMTLPVTASPDLTISAPVALSGTTPSPATTGLVTTAASAETNKD